MADSNVKMKFFADAQAAERAILQLEKKYTDLENKIGQVARKSKQGSDDGTAGLLMLASKAAAAVGGFTLLASAIEHVAGRQIELRRNAEAAAVALDKVITLQRIQAGGGEAEVISKQATQIAARAGVSQEAVLRVSRQLESSGFSKPMDSGATDSIIAFLQATAQDPATTDVEGIVAAFSQQLNASGQARTPENLLKLGTQFRGLFSTQLEAPDLVDFAKVRGLANNLGLSQEQFLGTSAVLKDVMGASEASTGFGNILSKLAAPKPTQLAALSSMGIEPTDVDFIGESITEVADRLRTAIDAMPAEARAPALGQLFGAEKTNLSAAIQLLDSSRSGQLPQFISQAVDRGEFDFSVNAARGTMEAAQNRLKAEQALEQYRMFEGGVIPESNIAMSREIGEMRLMRHFNDRGETLGGAGFRLINWIDAMLGTVTPGAGEGTFATDADVGRARRAQTPGMFSVDDLQEEMRRNNKLMEEQNAMMRDQRPAVNRNAHVE